MMPDAETMQAVLVAFGPLVTRYMAGRPRCLLCRHAPGSIPQVFLSDRVDNGAVAGCVSALCPRCELAPDLPARIQTALAEARDQGRAPWN
jgi:hypothetical protein